MAHVEKRNGRWRARYRAPDGRERSRTFDRRVDAERFLTGIESSKLTGSYVDPSSGQITVGEYAEQWMLAQVWRPTTRSKVQSNMAKHVLPALGQRRLAAVRPTEIQAFVRGLADDLAPSTTDVIYRYVAALFRAAVHDRLIGQTPCVGVKLPKQERTEVVPLDVAQVQALADAVPSRYRALVIVAAGTGLRQGEVFGLTLPAVDFLRRRLTVERQLVLVDGPGPTLAPPKTEASYRTVPAPDVVLVALSAHLAEYGTGSDELVFTNEKGEPIRRNRFAETWTRARTAAGVPDGSTFHALRHHYASLLIRHGESVKVVQARLGHASASETLDTYSHLWPDSEDRTREAVDSAYDSPASSTRPAVAGH